MKILALMFVSVAAVAASNEECDQKERDAQIAQEKQKLVPLNVEIDRLQKKPAGLFRDERLAEALEKRRVVDQRIREIAHPLDLVSLNEEIARLQQKPAGLFWDERLAEALEKRRTGSV